MISVKSAKNLLACETFTEFNSELDKVFRFQKKIRLIELPEIVQQHMATLYKQEMEANGGIHGDPRSCLKVPVSMKIESFFLQLFDRIKRLF